MMTLQQRWGAVLLANSLLQWRAIQQWMEAEAHFLGASKQAEQAEDAWFLARIACQHKADLEPCGYRRGERYRK